LKYDAEIIVIGAGPAGSRVAQRLAAAGYDVLLLERRRSLGEPVCCTGIISRECLSEFDIDPNLVLRHYHGASIHAPGGQVIDIQRPGVQAVAIDRAAFDRSMTERATASGARLLLGATVVNVETNDDQATVVVVHEGKTRQLTCRAVVIAAGLAQKLTRVLGLGRIGDAALGFQLDVETTEPAGVEIFLGSHLAPDFFGWLAPISDNKAKLGLIARRRADGHLQGLVELLRSQGKIGDAIGEVRCRAIPLSTLPRTYAERVLVVGDAAGQVKSTTGGGLYYGLVCADIAAETLHSALLNDDLSATSLAPYQRQWRRALGRDLLLGRLARKVFQRLGDRQVDRLLLRARDIGLIDRLVADDAVSFDRHGKALLNAAGRLWPAAFIFWSPAPR
jgi:geranylgeranyl reductase family protein